MTSPEEDGDLAPFPADRWPYDVLVERLTARMERGEFSATGKIPTARELQQRYHVGPGTIRHVWQVLLERGLIVRENGRGFTLA